MNKSFKIKLLVLCISFFSLGTYAQTEEQRKYVFSKITPEFMSMINSGKVSGLSTMKHSDYTYVDIYLDTADLALYKNNLSLRIRKRHFGNGIVEYGMQLKSEMIKHGDVRMEVEEDELDFYNIVLDDKTTVKLQDELNTVFKRFISLVESDENSIIRDDSIISSKLLNINKWIAFKLSSPIAPFQKLNRVESISKESLRTLKPVMIGKSQRQRVHIYIDRENTSDDLINFPASSRALSSTPEVLRSKTKIWTMESSFDSAKFYPLVNTLNNGSSFHQINEYEVENKYLPHANSNVLLNRFEQGLIKNYKADINLESKYKQSIKGLIK